MGSEVNRAAELAAAIPAFVNATVFLQVAIADQLGVPVSDLHCLNLVQSGAATTPTQIAERMGMTTGAVTKLLDRMEAERLVRRQPDPADRRRVAVRALPDRMAELAGLYQPMATYLQSQIERSTPAELEYLASFVAAASEAAVEETLRIRRGGTPHASRRPKADPKTQS